MPRWVSAAVLAALLAPGMANAFRAQGFLTPPQVQLNLLDGPTSSNVKAPNVPDGRRTPPPAATPGTSRSPRPELVNLNLRSTSPTITVADLYQAAQKAAEQHTVVAAGKQVPAAEVHHNAAGFSWIPIPVRH